MIDHPRLHVGFDGKLKSYMGHELPLENVAHGTIRANGDEWRDVFSWYTRAGEHVEMIVTDEESLVATLAAMKLLD